MSDISARLLSLSPEKRDLLLRRINPQRARALEQTPAPEAAAERPFVPGDQNFRLRMGGGDLDTLTFETCPRPSLRPRQVEIQVHAVSLNFRDVMTAMGLYPQTSEPLLGDCAGRVVSVGEGVQEFKAGDEVIALTQEPYSGFTKTRAASVVRKPDGMSFVEGATIPTVYLTAYYSLRHLARLSKGERILIHSAAGGVGLAAVQYAQWAGAEVIGTASNDEKRAYLRSLGVEHTANSRNPNFDEEVKDLTGGEGVDVVLNSLAGEAIPKGLSILRPLGRFIELGKRDLFGDGKLELALFRKFLTFSTVDLGTISLQRFFAPLFADVMGMFDKGAFRAVPVKEFSIGEISEAFKYMSRSQHIGKIALRVRDEKVLVTPRRADEPVNVQAADMLVCATA